MTPPIESVDDLAAQKRILYGIVKGGSTEEFFKVCDAFPFIPNGIYHYNIKIDHHFLLTVNVSKSNWKRSITVLFVHSEL